MILLQCSLSSLHFAHACLVGLEEETIHIGQLHFVIVKQNELRDRHIYMAWNYSEEEIYTVGAKSLHTPVIKLYGYLNWCRNVKHLLDTNHTFSIQGMSF